MLQKCKVCGLEFPKTTKYFKKYNSKNNNIEPGIVFILYVKNVKIRD